MKENLKYKLIASDLDGTLLDSEQRVSSENLRAIDAINAVGVQFVPCTGRALGEIPRELLDTFSVRYFITSNGAAVFDKVRNEMIITHYIPTLAAKIILDTVKDRSAYVLAHVDGVNYYDLKQLSNEDFDRCKVNAYYHDLIIKKASPKEDFYNYLLSARAIEMFCLIFGSPELLLECKQKFIDTGILTVIQTSENILEIVALGTNKGSTLAQLTSFFGISPSEVVAVGDSENDLSVMKIAGLSLAMANGASVVKDVADKVICSQDEHSAKYIYENIISK